MAILLPNTKVMYLRRPYLKWQSLKLCGLDNGNKCSIYICVTLNITSVLHSIDLIVVYYVLRLLIQIPQPPYRGLRGSGLEVLVHFGLEPLAVLSGVIGYIFKQ